jgi:hypothetical protein
MGGTTAMLSPVGPVAIALFVCASLPAAAVSHVSPNMLTRDCSRITQRCTDFHQTNSPYNPGVPSLYSTKWVWSWI